MKINQNTEFNINIKSVIGIIMFTSSLVGMYYTLQDDIEDAKKMPKAVIDRIGYDLKQDWHTNHINKLEDEVKELREWCKELDEEIYKKKR